MKWRTILPAQAALILFPMLAACTQTAAPAPTETPLPHPRPTTTATPTATPTLPDIPLPRQRPFRLLAVMVDYRTVDVRLASSSNVMPWGIVPLDPACGNPGEMCQNDSNGDGDLESCGYYPPTPGLSVDSIFGETLCPWGLSHDQLFTLKASGTYPPGQLVLITSCGLGVLAYSDCVEGKLTSEFYAAGESVNVAVQRGNLSINTIFALANRYAAEGGNHAAGLYDCDVEATPDPITGLDPGGKAAARYAYVEAPLDGCEYRLVVVPVLASLPEPGSSGDALVLGVATFAIAKWDRRPPYGDAQGTATQACGQADGGGFECGLVWGYLLGGAQPLDFLLEQTTETDNPFAPVLGY